MLEKQNQQSNPSENADKPAQDIPAQEGEPSSQNGKNEPSSQDPAIPESKSGVRKFFATVSAFLESMDEEEPEPPPPPEKPLKESLREFIERCRDREKRIAMLKEFGGWCWKVFLHGMAYVFLFALTIWGTIWALEFSDNHRIKFYPADEVVNYLAAEHEKLEEAAVQLTPSSGKTDDIPFGRFDTKCIETVKPVKIYADEYGVYLMTSKGWYNGEHGVFIAKDEEKMPPDINWGLIEGRIYTYAIYD